jgi:hypothetical protein
MNHAAEMNLAEISLVLYSFIDFNKGLNIFEDSSKLFFSMETILALKLST